MRQLTISDIRLGWLQRFCAVARHQNIVRAGHECNVDPTSISDSVQHLEDALCRPLIAPATAHLTAFGRGFVYQADKILSLSKISNRPLTNVSVGWLEALIAAVEHGSYVKAGKALGWKRYKVMRGVAEFENWAGHPLVYSAQGIIFTVEGERVAPWAREVVTILKNLRGSPEVWYCGKMKKRKVPWWLGTKLWTAPLDDTSTS